jgi:ankyrin repeat protein
LEGFEYLLRAGANINSRNVQGLTPYMFMAVEGGPAQLAFLEARGCDPGIWSECGQAVHLAAQAGNEPALLHLLPRSPSWHLLAPSTGTNALHDALRHNLAQAVQSILASASPHQLQACTAAGQSVYDLGVPRQPELRLPGKV